MRPSTRRGVRQLAECERYPRLAEKSISVGLERVELSSVLYKSTVLAVELQALLKIITFLDLSVSIGKFYNPMQPLLKYRDEKQETDYCPRKGFISTF